MAKEFQLRLSRGEKISLGKKIAQYNRKIDQELNSGTMDNYVPSKLDFNNLKLNLLTRRAYKQQLRRIDEFLSQDALEEVTQNNITLPKWQAQAIKDEVREAKRTIKRKLLEEDEGFGMGNKYYNELKDTLEYFNKNNFTDYKSLNRLIERAQIYGKGNYNLQKAKIFYNNFLDAYSPNVKGIKAPVKVARKKLVNIAKSFKNFIDFWKFIKDSDLADLKMKYDVEKGLISFGDDDQIFIDSVDELESKLKEIKK